MITIMDWIDLWVNLISIIAFGVFGIWILCLLFRNYYKKKKNVKGLKAVKNIEKGLESFSRIALTLFWIILKIVISVLLAIGSKPIIYSINSPLGEGYATFASYAIAICLYMLMPNFEKKTYWYKTEEKEK